MHRRTAQPRLVLTRALLTLAVVATLVVGSIATGATTATTASAAANPLRILPLGDSITSGINGHDSYRYPLGQSLAASECGYDFVGGLRGAYDTTAGTTVPSSTPGFTDQDHEGHAGFNTDQILAGVPGWVSGLTFDAVLLHAGHNDFFYTVGPQAATVSRDRLGSIIDALRARNPNVIVLVAKPIKAGTVATGSPTLFYSSARVDELAGLVDGLAATKTTAASPVVSVDLNSGFQTSWLYDGLHPDATGDAWMADRWKTALTPYLTCGVAPANQAPTVTNPGAQTSPQNAAIAPLAITATDPDAGQTLTYSATGLPAGLTIAPTTGTINGTPTTVGATTVTLTVTDNGTPALTATATFTWTVTAPGANQAPTVTNPGARTAPQGTAIAPLAITATDPDAGQTLTYSATGLPAGLTIAPTTGTITGTPTTVGATTVTVTATDNGTPVRTGTTTFTFTITTPAPPSALYRAVNLNGPAITAGGIAFESGTTAPNVTAGPNAFCNQAVPLIPATDASTATMLRCSNWGGGSSGARLTMSNVPNGSYQASFYVWEDNATQTFNLVINGATAATNVVSGPAGTWKVLGPYPVTVTNGSIAANTTGGDANLSGVVVRTAGTAPANQAPSVTNPGARTTTQGQPITPVAITGTDPDAGQTLTYSATGLPAGLAIGPTTGTITGTPTTVGASTVTVTVTDNGTPALAAAATFTWTVTAPTGGTNQAPTITNPGARTSTQGQPITPVAITGTDPDAGQTLTCSATGLPAGLAIAPATGTVTGTPTTVGASTVIVTVTDNGTPVRTATATFTWTVTATGTPSSVYRAINLNGPAITAGGIAFEAGTSAANFSAGPNAFCNQAVPLIPATDANTATMLRCSNWGRGTPGARATVSGVPLGTYQLSLYVWEDNDSETYSVVVNGTAVAANLVSGSAGTWKVLGPFPVTVTNGTVAITTSGGSANLSGLVLATGGSGTTNQVPTVTNPGALTSTQNAAIAPVTITATDPDAGQTLTWSATGLPAGLTIAPATGTVTGTPTTVGASTVTVTVADSGTPVRTATTTFTWTVAAPGGPSTTYRAINLNGPAITAGGIAFEAGLTAANFSAGPNAFCDQTVPLIPATDANTAALLRCSNWGQGTPGATATMTNVPNGAYRASVYVWEDNNSETYSVAINGTTVAPSVVSGPGGTWSVLGPFPITVTNGTIAVTTTGGAANLSGLVIATEGPATATTVAITAPTNGASVTRPTTITGTAADPAGLDHVHLQIRDTASGQYWNGTAFQAAVTEVLPALGTPGAATSTWSYIFDPPTISAQGYQLTATSHGLGGGESNPTTTSFGLTTGGGSGAFDPTKVTDTFVAGGNWTSAVSADFLPNGHALVLTQMGLVYDVNPATGAQTQALDIRSKVFSQGEAGALDLLVDSAGTGFYVYYSVAGSDRLRISHFDLGSATEQVIWNNPGLGYNTGNPYHVGGSINRGPDGKLYLGIGDRVEGRSNDLTNVFGKVLRINTDGSVPTDNPFYDGAGPNVDEIWAYGLRNPYRASFDPATGRYWAGEVGGNVAAQAYEEVDIIEAGQRYGWPDCEGPLGPPKNGPTCPAGVTAPVFSYPHDASGSQFFNRAIVGGEIYHGSAFPLEGYYLYADYPTDTFYWLQLGPDGRTAVANGRLASAAAPVPVWLGTGPDGNVYWLSLGPSGGGQLRRLGYTGVTNRPPTITAASANPTTGPSPLPVTFTGAASDPDGTPVSYSWTFGDGTTSALPSPTHTYATNGTYQARLQVSSGGTTVSSDLITITVGAPPTATITAPPTGTVFDAGASITVTGTGNDPDTGPLTGAALSWNIQFLHDDHAHPVTTGTGPSITFAIPTTGHDYTGNTRYRVDLTATDPDGISTTTSILLQPHKTPVTVTSNQATTMTVDNVTQTLPFTIDTLVGFQHAVSVPATTCVGGQVWNFSSWSDGGARVHTITVTAGLSLQATYVNSGTSCSGIGTVRYSLSPTRSGPIALQGATLARGTPVYVFLDPTIQTFTRVEFWLDQPVTSPPRQTEATYPYDFAGGATDTASPFLPSTLAPGSHTITTRATRTNGTSETVTTTFTVT